LDPLDPGREVSIGHVAARLLRERVETVGGSAIVESAPGEGATVLVRIAIDGEEPSRRAARVRE
jgi:signal transduction histidine kinase